MATYTPLMLTVADGIMNDLAFEVNADLLAALSTYIGYTGWTTSSTLNISGYNGFFRAKHVIDTQNADLIPNSSKFAAYLLAVDGFVLTLNEAINSANNAGNVAASSFTSMDNFTTGNISLVSTDPGAFASDLAATGEILDFSDLVHFGTPHALFAKLLEFNMSAVLRPNFTAYNINVNALTKSFKSQGTMPIREQRAIYEVAKSVNGSLLSDILIVMGVKTEGIETLADLIDVSKLFPTCRDNLQTLIKGQVHPIFTGTGVSQAVSGLSTDQASVVPEAVAVTSLAMRNALFQIKGISDLTPADLAEQAEGIELNTGLADVSAATSPIDPNTVSSLQGTLANGSGPQGIYLLTDGVGSATGLVHLEELNRINAIMAANSSAMSDVAAAIGANNQVDLDTALGNLPGADVSEVNSLYAAITAQVARENVIYTKLNGASFDPLLTPELDALAFASSLHGIADRTDDGDIVQVINQTKTSTLEGQAVDACMREGRNLAKLQAAGVGSDSVIPT